MTSKTSGFLAIIYFLMVLPMMAQEKDSTLISDMSEKNPMVKDTIIDTLALDMQNIEQMDRMDG